MGDDVEPKKTIILKSDAGGGGDPKSDAGGGAGLSGFFWKPVFFRFPKIWGMWTGCKLLEF